MKHPIYYLLATAICGYLALANARGWSFLHTVNPARFGPAGARATHK